MSKRAGSVLVRLVSQAGTGFFYQTRKNPKRILQKMVLRKHDPIVNRHVLFKETKVSKGKDNHKKSGQEHYTNY
jgi:large subunit ribosomal protein L33